MKTDDGTYIKCPHCKLDHRLPMCVFAHWSDVYTVTCENEGDKKGCNKKFHLQEGTVWK